MEQEIKTEETVSSVLGNKLVCRICEKECKGIKGIDTFTGESTGLNSNLYYAKESKEIEFHSLQKIHKKISKEDSKKGFTHWSIKAVKLKRTFLKTRWSGANLVDNKYYPKSYKPIDVEG